MKQIETWGDMKCKNVLFDSFVDEWSIDYSVLDDRIKGRKQLLFFIEDDKGEKFRYYLNTRLRTKLNEDTFIPTDNKSFQFNVESNN